MSKHQPGDIIKSNASYGDSSSYDGFQAQLGEQRRALRYRYTVALRAQVFTARGVLTEGEEITLEDLHDAMNGEDPSTRMRKLIVDGVVLEADDYQLRAAKCPPDAPYRVAPRSAIVISGVIRGPGEQVKADELTSEELEYFISRGKVIARTPNGSSKRRGGRGDDGPSAA